MNSSLSFSAGFFISLLFVILSPEISIAKSAQTCVSSCGKIPNITHPFRLRGDPKHCGDRKYELDCINNVAVLQLNSAQYKVQAIHYNNYTIRLVDPNIQDTNCSSIPRYFLDESNFTDIRPYHVSQNFDSYGWEFPLNEEIIFLTCENSVRLDDQKTSCLDDPHTYAIVGLDLKSWRPGCRLKLVSLTSRSMTNKLIDANKYSYSDMTNSLIEAYNYSYSDIHAALVYGFEVSWLHSVCHHFCGSRGCYFDKDVRIVSCDSDPNVCYYIGGKPHRCGFWVMLGAYTKAYIIAILTGIYKFITFRPTALDDANPINRGVVVGRYGLTSFVGARFLFGATLLTVLLIHKWRRRHLSMYENIEVFLHDNNLMPIRYSYKEIKSMAKGFKIKLGEGGFGSVYKGQLRSGPYVAIKMLGKSKGNGQDFISEVATIGRIHHVNVVRLIGFCVEGSTRALVYEFMPNGSLDKYIFGKEENVPISYEKIYEISLGIARGLAYLHQGCDMQILHFDIKPHNILLDENFIPKVSDFGLAKLHSREDSIVNMTAVRGTIGYIAPELYYHNIRRVSYKADVYSFGMLLMEMANRQRNWNSNAENSSENFIPTWIYDQLTQGKEIEMEDSTEEEKKVAKKMIFVALWCIQFKPSDRPPMNRVVKMLEGEVESLELPPELSLYPQETIGEDHQTNSDYNTSSDSVPSSSYTGKSATDPLMKNSG